MNKEVRRAFIAAIREFVQLVNSRTRDTDAPEVHRTRIVREDGQIALVDEVTHDLSNVVLGVFREMKTLPETKTLTEAILADKDLSEDILVSASGKPIMERSAQINWLTNYYLIPLTLQYLGADGSRKFETAEVDPILDSLEAFLKRTDIEVHVLGPLQNFESESDRLDLGSTVIRKLADADIQHMWDMGRYGSSIVDRQEVIHLNYGIENVLTRPRHGPIDSAAGSSAIYSTLSALRLLKPGAVGVSATFAQPVSATFGSAFAVTATSGPSPVRSGQGYALESSDTGVLREIVDLVDKIPSDGVVRSALRRFNFAYERSRPEDRLVDHWIALESLFSSESESQELKYKYGIRIGHYIGADANDRYEIFKRMMDSYKARSKVVHGKQAKNLGQAAVDTEAALRASLRRAAIDVRAPDLDELDRLAASGK